MEVALAWLASNVLVALAAAFVAGWLMFKRPEWVENTISKVLGWLGKSE